MDYEFEHENENFQSSKRINSVTKRPTDRWTNECRVPPWVMSKSCIKFLGPRSNALSESTETKKSTVQEEIILQLVAAGS